MGGREPGAAALAPHVFCVRALRRGAARVTRLSPEVLKHKRFSQNYVLGVSRSLEAREQHSSCTRGSRVVCVVVAPFLARGEVWTSPSPPRTPTAAPRTPTAAPRALRRRFVSLAAPAASPARSHSRAKRLARLAGRLTPRRAVVRRRQPPEHNKISVILYANPRWRRPCNPRCDEVSLECAGVLLNGVPRVLRCVLPTRSRPPPSGCSASVPSLFFMHSVGGCHGGGSSSAAPAFLFAAAP